MATDWQDLEARCARTGFSVRGGFHPSADDALPDIAGSPAATVVLLGNTGPAMWDAFSAARRERPELPGLDAWTREVVTALAAELGAGALFPFEGPPYWPFQRWARRAEPVFPSPLGMLIHPIFGLWHAYRAALLLPGELALPPRSAAESPCERCPDKPCLSACPVNAFSTTGYDVDACSRHLATDSGSPCMTGGCLARRACPAGHEHIYPAEQRRFHMLAFVRRR